MLCFASNSFLSQEDHVYTVYICSVSVLLKLLTVAKQNIILPLPTPRSEGGESIMSILDAFILSVLASVVACYICKGLDGE